MAPEKNFSRREFIHCSAAGLAAASAGGSIGPLALCSACPGYIDGAAS